MPIKRLLAIMVASANLEDFINRYNAIKAPYHTGSWDERKIHHE